jgi:hypothetical protein
MVDIVFSRFPIRHVSVYNVYASDKKKIITYILWSYELFLSSSNNEKNVAVFD